MNRVDDSAESCATGRQAKPVHIELFRVLTLRLFAQHKVFKAVHDSA